MDHPLTHLFARPRRVLFFASRLSRLGDFGKGTAVRLAASHGGPPRAGEVDGHAEAQRMKGRPR